MINPPLKSEKIMKSLKIKLCLIVALALTMIITLGIFFGNIALANRYVTLSGTTTFYTTDDAAVWAHRIHVVEGEEEEEETFNPENPDYVYYTMFTFEHDKSKVEYRRNLAFHWYYNLGDFDDYLLKPYEGQNGNWWIRDKDTGIEYDEDDKDDWKVNDDGFWTFGEEVTDIKEKVASEMGEGYLRMEIGFEEINFEKYIIAFESQQYNMTKDEKTTNYIIFIGVEPEDGESPVNKVYAVITDDKDIAEAKKEDIDVSGCVALDIDHIVIQLGESDGEKGEFAVSVSTAQAKQTGTFKNIGKMYAKYVSSSTKPVTPLTFKAEFEKDEDGEQIEGSRARMVLYELNGQSFILNRGANGKVATTSSRISRHVDSDGNVHYTGGQVNDTQPPVLCLDSGVTYIRKNSELTFSYTAVDVLTQSPTTVTAYFMLTNEQAKNGVEADNFEAERLFKTVTSDEDVFIYPHTNHYAPKADEDYNTTVNGKSYGTKFYSGDDGEFLPVAAMKIYLKLTDTASTGNQSTFVFLDWFVEDEYKLYIDGHEYLAVATDEEGATFNYGEDNNSFTEDNEIWQAYNEKVQEAAKDLRAGSDADFYLPSLEMLVGDNATAYEDMTFSIYYLVNGKESSNTGRSTSQLYIKLTAAGDYIFTVYANDKASNSMWYIDNEGEIQKFAASDIWNMYDDEDEEEQLRYKLPWFRFTAGIADISVEDPGEQSTAYVGTTYTASTFDVEGLSTKSTYTLYRFEQELYAKDNDGKALTYQQFMEDKKSLFENHREYFTNIIAQSELEEDSEEYDKFYDYAWNSGSRSFIPQEANTFYLIECKVTSTQFPTREAVKEYMGIAASVTPRAIEGEDTWLQDNMTSIILLSIAGAAFIGILLLLFIKPKNNGDIDVQFEQEVEAKAVKKQKRNK